MDKPAKGTRGFLIRTFNGYNVFRVYEKDGSFKDYNIYHDDLEITIEDDFATLYGDKETLDYSPEVLGKKCEHEYDHNGECLKCDESILDHV